MSAQFGSEIRSDRTIAAWLEQGPTTLPAHVVERTFVDIHRKWPVTARRTTWRRRWLQRSSGDRRLLQSLAVAAVIVALVGAGLRLTSAPSIGSQPSGSASPSSAAPSAVPSLLSNSFTPTGSMAIRRMHQTATLLADGRVVVIGGSRFVGDQAPSVLSDDPLNASAEVYDPIVGAFAQTASMTMSRSHHTATLLNDGRVLVTGGGNASFEFDQSFHFMGFATAAAETFDPSTGDFTLTGAMHEARIDAAAVRLTDGRVLIAGGYGLDQDRVSPILSAELYDPTAGSFTLTGELHTAFLWASGLPLGDGRAIVFGREASGNYPSAFAIYDAATGRFGEPRALASTVHTGVVLADGRVVFVEGDNHAVPGASAEDMVAQLYDPRTEALTLVPAPGPAIDLQPSAATLLADGRVLLIGFTGRADEDRPHAAVLFDPTTGAFSMAANTPHAAEGETATLLGDGSVLVVGGGPSSRRFPTYTTAEVFR